MARASSSAGQPADCRGRGSDRAVRIARRDRQWASDVDPEILALLGAARGPAKESTLDARSAGREGLQASGGGEQALPEASGFPAAALAGEGEHLGPGEQVAGEPDDLVSQLVLRESSERQVQQPGVLGAADAVFAETRLRPQPQEWYDVFMLWS
jgi:hypothetical protein